MAPVVVFAVSDDHCKYRVVSGKHRLFLHLKGTKGSPEKSRVIMSMGSYKYAKFLQRMLKIVTLTL